MKHAATWSAMTFCFPRNRLSAKKAHINEVTFVRTATEVGLDHRDISWMFCSWSDKKRPSQHVFHWKSPLFHGKCWLRCIIQCIFDILSAWTFVLSLILQVVYKSSALIDTINLHQTRKEFLRIDTLLASFPRYKNQLCTAWLPILVFLLGKLFFLANCFMASKRLHP